MRAHAKLFQPPEGEETLLHGCACVFGTFKSLMIWRQRNLKFPVVHNQLIGQLLDLADVEGEGEVVAPAPHCQVTDILLVG